MITAREEQKAMRLAAAAFAKAGVFLTPAEKGRIEVCDFGLSDLKVTGLQILTYLNTKRCCAKELMLLPGQICPEHLHLTKEETFRCRSGLVHLHVNGKKITLKPGGQFTLAPNQRHWFQGGPQGAVVSEFSTRSNDATDRFTDPKVRRRTIVKG